MKERDQRPTLGVSACLLGEEVRYDGKDKFDQRVAALAAHFNLDPLCPEADAGLGVPRPPVRLVRREDGIHAVGVDDPALDVTEALRSFAQGFDRHNAVDGLVLKARSPSCAVSDAPLEGGEETVPGLFTAHMMARRPWLPCIQEDRLGDAWLRLHFVERAWLGFALRVGRLGCLRPSWVYRLQGRGPGGIEQDPARSLEEALARPWMEAQIARQAAFLQDDPDLPPRWRAPLEEARGQGDRARRLGLLLAALAALDGDAAGESLFLSQAGLSPVRETEAAPC